MAGTRGSGQGAETSGQKVGSREKEAGALGEEGGWRHRFFFYHIFKINMIKKSEKFIILHFIIFSTVKMFIILHFIIFLTNPEIFIIFILSYFKYDNIVFELDFGKKIVFQIFGRRNILANIPIWLVTKSNTLDALFVENALRFVNCSKTPDQGLLR